VSNVQRGGAMSHGTRDDRWKPEQATKLALAEQVFTDLLRALAEIVLKPTKFY